MIPDQSNTQSPAQFPGCDPQTIARAHGSSGLIEPRMTRRGPEGVVTWCPKEPIVYSVHSHRVLLHHALIELMQSKIFNNGPCTSQPQHTLKRAAMQLQMQHLQRVLLIADWSVQVVVA